MKLRAPGKLFLIGEYAVLEGGQALVGAVDRYAEVSVEPFAAPAWRDASGTIPALDGLSSSSLPSLVEAVISTLVGSGASLASVVVSADSSRLNGAEKLGLGSSGAVCAGLVRALAPGLPKDEALAIALRAHRAFQGGRGSGGDVIASSIGGLCVVESGRLLRRLSTTSLTMVVIDTGVAANTRALVDQFRVWRTSRPEADSVVAELRQTASSAIDALERRDLAAWCDHIREYAMLERAMTHGGVDVFAEPVEHAVGLLESAGWAAKPSGAGGGDVIVAFHPSAAPEELDELCRINGLSRIPLALEWSGVLDGAR